MSKFKRERKPSYDTPSRQKSKVRSLAGAVQRFMLRVCFNGTLSFTCPACGTKNVKRLTPFSWWVRCTGSTITSSAASRGEALNTDPATKRQTSCKRIYIPFLGLIPLGSGQRLPPRDYVVPNGLPDAYPLGEYIREPRWLSGDPVHRVDLHPSFCCLHKRYCDKIDLQSTSENEDADDKDARADPTR